MPRRLPALAVLALVVLAAGPGAGPGCRPPAPEAPAPAPVSPGAPALADLVNHRRAALGRRPLRHDARLESAARRHAGDLALVRPADPRHWHRLPGGPGLPERVADAGYRPSRPSGWVAGETVAPVDDPATAWALWLHSDPHREQLLDPAAVALGTARSRGWSVAVVGY
ncbi:CAP domain-containing protein [Tautonia plasticadhaerens]|uniref:Cysteine-rich secretory protein family protein n=1 Tax=Tautonia plasticadhaerens TaxID=2527974 RepID=A0A518GZM5_9BACT|nr:CAP domain-containing protein [Tautonia plasticadhaerens]QDV34037.1 Cysteine-rich secretory protein family protein [Tautonia plasticadhaerens]